MGLDLCFGGNSGFPDKIFSWFFGGKPDSMCKVWRQKFWGKTGSTPSPPILLKWCALMPPSISITPTAMLDC